MIKKIVSVLSAVSLSLGMLSTVPVTAETEEIGAVKAGTVTVDASADKVSVPVTMDVNPGIIAMRLAVEYDPAVLKLSGATDCQLLGDSFLAGTDNGEGRFYIIWDDLGEENFTNTGDLALIDFTLPGSDFKSTDVKVTVDSAIDKDLNEVAFTAESGAVLTAAGSLSTELEAYPVGIGGTVGVEIHLNDNPGLTAMKLAVSYDTKALKLSDFTDGDVFNGAKISPSEKPESSPVYFVWDDTTAHTEDGKLITLIFEVLRGGEFEIGVTVVDAADDTPAQVGISGTAVKIISDDTTTSTTVSTTTTTSTTKTTTTTTQTTTSTTKTTTTTTKTTTSTTKTTTTTTSTTTSTTSTTEQPTWGETPGDVNGDGKASVADAVCFIVFITEGQSTKETGSPTAAALILCDYNNDGVLTISDYVLLLKELLKL